MKKAIYPGSFDPITFGHVDMIKRGLAVVDHLIVGLSNNQEKSPVFTLEERKRLIEETFIGEKHLSVVIFDGLLVEFARKNNISLVIRGLRAASDFDYEFQLAAMNRCLYHNFETMFLMAGNDTYFLSSRLVKEIAFLGGDVGKMVPSHVVEALNKKRESY